MKVKAVISAALLCAFAISASGCDGADIGTDNLIRPPKTVGDEAEIEQLIADTAGSGYTLRYPKSGKTLTMTVPTKQLLFTARLTKPKRKCICL